MRFKQGILILLFQLALFGNPGYAQQKEYIEKYKDVAIREMKAYGIPASITLAQGILESASGTSYLATKANNHFGIKCHRDWKGKKVYRDDDEKNECFRHYDNAEQSFVDHSKFLKNRSRYAFLFEEDITDYKAWAKGLKKAGYATNPKYPQLLIRIIEDYNLSQYDNMEPAKEPVVPTFGSHIVLTSENDVEYVEILAGDSFESIAKETETSIKRLLKYNELNYDAQLKEGQRIYLQPKRKRAKQLTYVLQEGDSMYEVSQKFAIKLKYIYKRNKLSVGQQLPAGTSILLR